MTGFGLSNVATIVWGNCEKPLGWVFHQLFSKGWGWVQTEKCLILRNCGNSHAVRGGVDGCHIPCKCPKSGAEARKEYYNFKNFYSIVLVALVDAKYRFMWGSCGFPENSHDSIIFQSTSLREEVQQGTVIPNIGKITDGVHISPVRAVDLAFQFSTWLTKPYTNAILSQEQSILIIVYG